MSVPVASLIALLAVWSMFGRPDQVGRSLWNAAILRPWEQIRSLYRHATRMQVALALIVLLAVIVSLFRYTIMSAIWYRQARARKRMYSDHDWTA